MDRKELKYHCLYADIAKRCAEMSHAIRLQVGCVVVKNGNVLSMGWNGMPEGFPNDCEHRLYMDVDYPHFNDDAEEAFPYFDEDRRRYKLVTRDEVLHAEENALMKLTRSTESAEGATLYITHAPCIRCAKLIHGARISHVVYDQTYKTTEGIDFLIKCGIRVTNLDEALEQFIDEELRNERS